MQRSEINVMIVEDDKTQGKALVEAVKSLGYRAILVEKPEEAESIARIKPVHGAIVDCMLPGQSGVDLVESLNNNVVEGFAVILVSGIYRDRSFQSEAIKKVGALDFFSKPFDLKKLLDCLEGGLRKFVDQPKVDLHALISVPMASERERRKGLDHVEELYGYDLPFVFCILMEAESSGHLNIVDDQGNLFGVSFAEGHISKVDSESSVVTSRAILEKHGFISDQEISELRNKKAPDLVKSLVDEGLMSPHVQNLVKVEQIVNELNALISSNAIRINFVPDRKIKLEENDINISSLMNHIHDIIETKIPLDYLKKFYSTWLGHPIEKGPSYTDSPYIFSLPMLSCCKNLKELLGNNYTLEELIGILDCDQELAYKAIHLLALRRVIVFSEKQRVRNLDDHVNRLTSLHENVVGKSPLEIFKFFGLSEHSKVQDYRKVYREFVRSNHPDNLPQAISEDIRKINHELFAHVTSAHDIMVDPDKREAYFRSLKQDDIQRQLKAEDLLSESFGLISRGKYENGLDLAQKSIKEFSTDKGLLYSIWCQAKLNALDQKNVKKELENIRSLSRHCRQTALYYFVSGLLRVLLGQNNDAAKDFYRSLQIEPNFNESRKELNLLKGKNSSLNLNDVLNGDISQVFSKIFNRKNSA